MKKLTNFGENLRLTRKTKSLTQTELASKLNISQKSYSNWEKGKREPSFSKLIELSKLLNTTPNYLLGVSDA
ncbi:TPA: helix-turn-helix transcriptional regulator [Streptococcus agalactiae]|uniref:Transcriptional regulator n=1 Tax=Streptococcus agalactiae TaxID=1311 RepID=A0A853P5D2_STRAG|nr:helix-turn-helix transcriptional regulator [Streptococcus agalactiae]AIF87493.1 Cro/Cl family transcriptional regulator [Streptococcus agalactiae]EMA8747131.1 helix-turn-helix transcriptional regulator [Streptococcus agalactiae]EMC0661549.1 helix-turn-helix transcriptional regulator [Streptococcus agalactiae]EPV45696.1 hypothetical protein SAG0353_10485 [Streptococcus agalactiae GB00901]KXA51973.1 DNA-binding helix-turn-helix protein [Streptococcus agalactiae]